MEISEIEKQIIELTADEYTAKTISTKLNISLKAVHNHKERLRKKTNTLNSVGLIIWAIKNNIIIIT